MIKPVKLLKQDEEAIIKTHYGAKEIPHCFGYMDLQNPMTLISDPFTNPAEQQESRRIFNQKVKDALKQTIMCTKCFLFDQCTKASLVMQQREALKQTPLKEPVV